MNAVRPGSRRARVLALVAVGAGAAATLAGGPWGPPPGGAANPFQAGEPATVRSAVPAAEVGVVRGRALARARTLGLPTGTGARLARVLDRFTGETLDEVVTTDDRGRRLGIVQLDRAGRVVMAVRLGWPAAAGPGIGAAAARDRAAGIAADAGLAAAGTPAVDAVPGGGWRVAWPRTVDDVPVLGDGTVITLLDDGSFHAAARRERRLAAPPSATMTAAAATRVAEARLGSLLGARSADARIAGSRLAWIAPNDTFDGSRPDAPDPTLRLAWVMEVRTSGVLADQLRALELYLDAGDGSLLGGDLLR